MRVLNNTDHSIHIKDINLTLPSKKNGSYNIMDEVFFKSDQIIALMRNGSVSVISKSFESYDIIVENGKILYCVNGSVVWEGKGKTEATIKKTFSKSAPLEEIIKSRKEATKSSPKRYVVTKNVPYNVSIERTSFCLTKQNPSLQMSSEIYNSSEIQRALSSGILALTATYSSSVDKNGFLIWEKEEEKCQEKSKDNGEEIKVKEDNPLDNVSKTDEYKGVHCLWDGPTLDVGGYANMNRQYIFNLDKLGVSVKAVIVESGRDVESEMTQRVIDFSRTVVKPKSPHVFATNSPGKGDGTVISYTMMESELAIHKVLADKIAKADEVWVPSEWNQETFRNSGIKKPILVMPLGVDKEVYCPKEQSVFFSFPTKKYVFYASSTWIWRKGWDVLLKAYSKAFTSDDDVSLIIFSHVPARPTDQYEFFINNQIRSMFSGKDISKFPHLAIVTSILPSYIVPLMYNSVNSFVLFSRGEGWGLPYCEATASGLPVIGADHGGQKMFLNNDNSLLVKPDMVVSCHPSLLYMSPYYQGMRFVNFSEKVICEAAEKMRYAYENQGKVEEMAKKCRENLLSNFTWDKCARRVAERLKLIQ